MPVKTLEEDAEELVTFALVEEVTEEDAAEVAGLAGFIVVTLEELAATEDVEVDDVEVDDVEVEDVEVEEPFASAEARLDDTAADVDDVDDVDDDEDDEDEDTVLMSGSTSSANSPK